MRPPLFAGNDYRFNHLGVAVANLPEAIAVYEDLFGYSLLAGPYDDDAQQATVAFVGKPGSFEKQSASDFVLELIAPLDKSSHVARLLSSGGGAYHVCYEVADLLARLEELRSKKCLIVRGPHAAVAYDGRRIAWIYTPTRQLVELVEL